MEVIIVDSIINYCKNNPIGSTIAYGTFFLMFFCLSISYYKAVHFFISNYIYNDVYEVASFIGTIAVIFIAYIIYMVGSIEAIIRFSRFMDF